MAKINWMVARHMYYGGIVLAHEAKLGNRYVSIENLGRDYKEISMYEFRKIDTDGEPHEKMGWVCVHSTSFEKTKEAKACGESWLKRRLVEVVRGC